MRRRDGVTGVIEAGIHLLRKPIVIPANMEVAGVGMAVGDVLFTDGWLLRTPIGRAPTPALGLVSQRHLAHCFSAVLRPFCAVFPPFFCAVRLPGAETERTGEKWRKMGEIWGRNGRETAVAEWRWAQSVVGGDVRGLPAPVLGRQYTPPERDGTPSLGLGEEPHAGWAGAVGQLGPGQPVPPQLMPVLWSPDAP